jgi:hypothetical protein
MKSKSIQYLFIFILAGLTSSCASYEVSPSGRPIRTENEYFKVVDEYSDQASRFSGLYNLLDIQGTLLNSKVMDAQEDQLNRIYLWDEKKVIEEKSKSELRLAKETEIFLSFYSPERKSDDLNRPNSQWRVFLDVGNNRYEGKISKVKATTSELSSIYPMYNRFYTPYAVVFSVPMKTIESQPIKMTLTGSVGSATLSFKPLMFEPKTILVK